jgi:hypothetical protein
MVSFIPDPPGDTAYPTPFKLFSLTPTTATIKNNRGTTESAWFRGVKKTVNTGAGLTWDAVADTWVTGTLAANAWIYLSFERATLAVSIVAAAALPDGDDDTEIFPLWYLPWSSTTSSIDTANIVDLRNSYRIAGMG